MKYQVNEYISIDPMVMRGKPVISGTRITVEFVLSQFGQWRNMEYMLENYPHLKSEDILAALKYAAMSLHHDQYVNHE